MKSKTANGTATLEVVAPKENNALTVVAKKGMSVNEKIDSMHKLEAIVAKVEYLRDRKKDIEQFGIGVNGFQGAKLSLESSGCEDVTVSNPAIVEELLGIAKLRLKDLLIKAERELEEFQII